MSCNKCAVQDIAIVEPQSTVSNGLANGSGEAALEADPRHCVLLRAGGLLSVLDMDQVRMRLCSRSV